MLFGYGLSRKSGLSRSDIVVNRKTIIKSFHLLGLDFHKWYM